MADMKFWEGAMVFAPNAEGTQRRATIRKADPVRGYRVRDYDAYHETWWCKPEDVTGWKPEGDRWAVGDHVTLIAGDDGRGPYRGDAVPSVNEWAVGRKATITSIDEYDDTLHYNVQVDNEDESAPGDTPSYFYRRGSGSWVRTEYLTDYADDVEDLPSFNLEATVSESLGMWRPPKVTS